MYNWPQTEFSPFAFGCMIEMVEVAKITRRVCPLFCKNVSAAIPYIERIRLRVTHLSATTLHSSNIILYGLTTLEPVIDWSHADILLFTLLSYYILPILITDTYWYRCYFVYYVDPATFLGLLEKDLEIISKFYVHPFGYSLAPWKHLIQ